MKLRDLEWRPRPVVSARADPNAKRAQHFFDNGYGVSVITGRLSYTDEDRPYEVAVLRGTPERFDLAYDTPITDDVRGYCDEAEANDILAQIENLNPAQ